MHLAVAEACRGSVYFVFTDAIDRSSEVFVLLEDMPSVTRAQPISCDLLRSLPNSAELSRAPLSSLSRLLLAVTAS